MYGSSQSLYDVLGVPRDATLPEIVRAYRRRRAALDHESAAPNPELGRLLQQAHDVLTDDGRRADYDATLKSARAAPARTRAAKGKAKLKLSPQAWLGVGALVACAILYLGASHYYAGLRAGPEEIEAPTTLAATEVLAMVQSTVAWVKRLEISGRAATLGVAATIEPGRMITPCFDVPAGANLVVDFGARTAAAQLAVGTHAGNLCVVEVAGGASSALPAARVPLKPEDALFVAVFGERAQLRVVEGRARGTLGGSLFELALPAGTAVEHGTPVLNTQGELVALVSTTHALAPRVAAVPLSASLMASAAESAARRAGRASARAGSAGGTRGTGIGARRVIETGFSGDIEERDDGSMLPRDRLDKGVMGKEVWFWANTVNRDTVTPNVMRCVVKYHPQAAPLVDDSDPEPIPDPTPEGYYGCGIETGRGMFEGTYYFQIFIDGGLLAEGNIKIEKAFMSRIKWRSPGYYLLGLLAFLVVAYRWWTSKRAT